VHTKTKHKYNTDFVVVQDGIYICGSPDTPFVYILKILTHLPQLLLLKTNIQMNDSGICKAFIKNNPCILLEEEFDTMMKYLTGLEYECCNCDFEYDSLPAQEIVAEHLTECLNMNH